ncbi:hypothetical protein ACQ7HM_04070 [Williamsia sp. MIQD14]|uniref:hypothetical protein n=1 Tax=Williamsia sp. MIQD14 TaxID=3425703 RepID=UPI003DA14D44
MNPDTVMVVGVGRSGVTTLIDAFALVDPGLTVVRAAPDDLSPPVRARVGLLVIDPSSVVGDEEAALFSRLRAVASTVAVVCTKVDAFWDWPTNARASRAVLDPTGRWPVFAVSGAAAVAGAVDESGVDELVGWIRQSPPVASHAAAADDRVARRRSATDLAATRARLVRGRDRGRADRLAALRSGLASIRARAVADLNAGVRDIGATSRDTVAGLRDDDVAAHAEWVGAAMTHLRDHLDARVRTELDQIRAVALLGIEPVAPVSPAPRRPPVRLRPRAQRRRGAEDVLLVLFGASGGAALGRLVVTPLAQVHTLQWISMPVALIIGVAMAIGVVRLRRVAALRTAVRTWTTEAVGEARAAIEHDLLDRITAAEPVVAGQIARHHERRARVVAEEVAAIDREIRGSRPEGTGRAVATSEHGRTIDEGKQR